MLHQSNDGLAGLCEVLLKLLQISEILIYYTELAS